MIPIATILDEYIALERRLHGEIASLSGKFCAVCKTICCCSRHCIGVTESAFLRACVERQGRVLPPGEAKEGELSFLTLKGCSLEAGRPMECTWYVCDDISAAIADPLERYVYQILSSVLAYVVRRATSDDDLTEVEDLERLTPRQREKIRERIVQADRAITEAMALLRDRDRETSVQETAERMLFLSRLFPYAASSVRFAGEAPSLSRAGRERIRPAS